VAATREPDEAPPERAHLDHGHLGVVRSGSADRRWLLGALALIVSFMIGEVVAGLLAHSLALLSDAGHMLTDAAALSLAVVTSRVVERPAKGAYTYGFARVDALSGQANGITLLLLAAWFTVESVRRLLHPPASAGGVMVVVAVIGVGVNVTATALAARADRRSLNVRGAVAHLMNDIWAFVATFVAGVVIMVSGWTRADAAASLVVASLMAWTGVQLIRAAGRVFLEAAPANLDPMSIGARLAGLEGVEQIHDLHVWEIAAGEAAVSAHVLVKSTMDCHVVGGALRSLLASDYAIDHVTLQVDHCSDVGEDHCVDSHGPVHTTGPDAGAVR
jgi:cobalt-zinc-cadmium efflux system protein